MYTDNFQLFSSFNVGTCSCDLQSDIDNLVARSSLSFMKLNLKKCKKLQVARKKTLFTECFIDLQILENVKSFFDLWVLLNQRLLLNLHFGFAINKAKIAFVFIKRWSSEFSDHHVA